MPKNVEDSHNICNHRHVLLPLEHDNIPIQDNLTDEIQRCEDIIVLNVGGTRYEILKSNFAFWPTTRLSQLVRAKTDVEILKLCDGFLPAANTYKPREYFFLRNWSNFNAILDMCYMMKRLY